MTDTKSQIQENQIISRGINTQTNNRINKQIIINPIQYQAYNNQIAIKQKEKLFDIGIGNVFLDMTPKAQAIQEKIDKWNCMK